MPRHDASSDPGKIVDKESLFHRERPVGQRDYDLPVVVPKEVNFSRLPVFPVSDSTFDPGTPYRYEFEAHDEQGNRRSGIWIVSPDPERGDLTPFDGRVFTALEAHLTQQLAVEGTLPRMVPIPINRIGMLLGYTKMRGYRQSPGSVYGSIKRSLRRIGAVRFSSEQAFWSSDEKNWISVDFNVYPTVHFRGHKTRSGEVFERGWIELHEIYRHNLLTQNVKYYDYEYLLSLPPLAARVYQLLSLKFYGIRQRNPGRKWYRVDYQRWCSELPARPQRSTNKGKMILDRAHAKLIDTGFLTEVRYGKTQRKGGRLTFNVSYFMGERALQEMQGKFGTVALQAPTGLAVVDHQIGPPANAQMSLTSLVSASTPPDDDETELAPGTELSRALCERDVKRTDAVRLVADHPEQLVRDQVEHCDYVVETMPTTIKNRGAWLRRAIEENWPLPDDLVERRKRLVRESEGEDRLLRWSVERKRRIDADLRDWDTVPIEDRIAGRLTFLTMDMNRDFQARVRTLGSKDAAAEQVRQELLADLPQTEEERRAYLEHRHESNPPADFK